MLVPIGDERPLINTTKITNPKNNTSWAVRVINITQDLKDLFKKSEFGTKSITNLPGIHGTLSHNPLVALGVTSVLGTLKIPWLLGKPHCNSAFYMVGWVA